MWKFTPSFSEATTNIRHYVVSWMDADYPFLVFNYAVAANHRAPTGPPPFEPQDFPISGANMAEAFCISASVVDNSLYFNDDGYGGGAIDLDAEIWDWQGLGSTEVTVESVQPGIVLPVVSGEHQPGHTSYSDIYHFFGVIGFPKAPGDLELLITATDKSITFGGCWINGLLSKDNPYYYKPVYTCQKISVNVPEVIMDWIPKDGQTGVQLSKTPDQGSRPPDLAVFSEDPNQSRGVTLTQWAQLFMEWKDGYNSDADDFPWLDGNFLNDVNHIDFTLDGRKCAITSFTQENFGGGYIRSQLIGLINEQTGDYGKGFHGYFGFGNYIRDMGDVSTGIIGFDGSENGQDANVYFVDGYSTIDGNPDPDNPIPDDGAYYVHDWLWPYWVPDGPLPAFALSIFGISARDPNNPGPIKDFEPRNQRLGVDDNTGVYLTGINPGHPPTDWAEFFYILDNAGMLHMLITEFQYPSQTIYVAGMPPETWQGTAIDVEVAPAFTYTDWSPWGWSEVLIDKGNGTWVVMTLLWDPTQNPPVVYVIDITDPLPGTPLALDVDNTDFELHVIAGVGEKVQATVFEWFDNF